MLNVGDTLGPYVLEAALASGGMGAVYRARNRVTGQLRALKVVRADLGNQKDFIDRFVREATIASQLRHPNLVETLEPGIDGETVYLPMELLIGETLAARLKRVQRFTMAEAASIIVPVAEAVHQLHQRGVIHRDLKPANIFIARVGEVDVPKVIDLGTARDVDDDEHTRTGLVVGSPYYMAIEQAEGRRDIDGRADQYSLGVVAYQMVTGTRPYESDDTRSAIAKLLRGDPYLPASRVFPGVSAAMESVIAKALDRERDQRFRTIGEFAQAFAAAVNAPASAFVEARAISSRPALAGGSAPHVVGGASGSATDSIAATVATMAGEVNPLEEAAKAALAEVPAAIGFAAPPPTFAAPPVAATKSGSRSLAVVGVIVVLSVVLVGVATFLAWPRTTASSGSVVAVPLGAPDTVPATTIATPPPTSVRVAAPPPPTTLATPAPPTTAAPPSVLAPPSTRIAAPPSTRIAAPPSVLAPPSSAAPPSTRIAPPSSAPPPSTRIAPPSSPAPPTTLRHRPPPTSGAPCGAATGIPCLD